VDPHLFYLVFGESVLNDAVGLVLFDAFSKFVVEDNGAGKVVVGMGEFIIGFLFDSIGSPTLGLLCGCLAALLFKHVDMRDNRLVELSVYMLIMYFPFLLAQVLKLSGIVTILFTGMTARAYVVPNLSEETADSAEILFRLFAHLAETSIFLELGMSVFGLRGSFKGLFTLWTLLACLVGRALNVYPITFFYNLRLQREPKSAEEVKEERRMSRRRKSFARVENKNHVKMTDNLKDSDYHGPGAPMENDLSLTNSNGPAGLVIQSSPSSNSDIGQPQTPRVRRDLKIRYRTAHMMCFAGLRGAVAYACVRAFPDTFDHQNEFTVTTMVIILVTVFALGSTTKTMLAFLQIETDVDEDKYMENWHQERRSASILLRIEDLIHRNVVRQEVDSVVSGEPLNQQSPSVYAENSHAPGTYSQVNDEEEDQIRTKASGEPRTPTNTNVGASKTRRKSSLFDYGANL
jgi:NhaP-type Na+/H+ or K+/H+ antiporter